MVTRVDSSFPVVVNPSRSYAKPIIAVLAVAALGYLLIQVVRCLIGRIQPKSTAAQLYALGCEALRDGKNAVAISEFTLALQRMPNQQLLVKVLADRAFAYSENKQYHEALADFDRALKLPFSDNDFHAMVFCRRAASYFVLENYAQSLSDFDAAFALDPQDPHLRAEILAYRAAANLKLNQPETVLKDLTDALACSFDDPNLRRYIFTARGDFYTQTDAHAQAAADYNQALYCEPYEEDVFAHLVYKRGCAFSSLQQWDDALRDYQDVLDSNFSDDQLRANILSWRATIYITREAFQLAANDLTGAIDLNPSEDLDQMLYMRALVYTKLNRYPEAIGDFTTVIEMNADDEDRKAALLVERSRAHRENKNQAMAAQDFEAALRCKITKEGLREALEAELNPETASPVSKMSVFLDWITTKFPGSQKK